MPQKELCRATIRTDWDGLGCFFLFDVPVLFPYLIRVRAGNAINNDIKFKRHQSGNPQTTFKPGNPHRWQPGQSGNPARIARGRLSFEESLYAALPDRRGGYGTLD